MADAIQYGFLRLKIEVLLFQVNRLLLRDIDGLQSAEIRRSHSKAAAVGAVRYLDKNVQDSSKTSSGNEYICKCHRETLARPSVGEPGTSPMKT